MKKDVFLHIGYPKCMSTALQRNFFEIHPEISFGGIGVNDNISYSNSFVEEFFEIILKYANKPYYLNKISKIKENIDKFVEEADGVPLFSNENISLNFSLQGLPTYVKYERFLQVFENFNVKLIAVKRKPIEIVRGVYKEYVRMGYDESYEEYLKWLITLHDRNFLSDLAFLRKNKELVDYFGDNNILWVDYNTQGRYKKNNDKAYITQSICDYMKISFNEKFILDKINPSLTDVEVNKLLEINKTYKREMGLRMTEPFERHRSKIIFNSSKVHIEEKEIFSNVLQKRKAMSLMEKKNTELVEENIDQIKNLEDLVLEIIESYNEFSGI